MQKLVSLSFSPSSSLSSPDSEFETTRQLEQLIFTAINEGNKEKLGHIYATYHQHSTAILQLLLTTAYPNEDKFYHFDEEVVLDAEELLGGSCLGLNAIHIACILGDEDVAFEILDFVTNFTVEIEAKKILYEFMGRTWGNGNTVLHLAAFMGMSDLVHKLLELGAAPNRVNERKYKPVDCADDDDMRTIFTTITELAPPQKQPLTLAKTTSRSTDELNPRRAFDSPPCINSAPVSYSMHSLSENGNTVSINPRKSAESAISPVPKKRHSIAAGFADAPLVNTPYQATSSSIAQSSIGLIIETSIHPAKKIIPKFLRKVTFDARTLIFEICCFGDPVDNIKLPTLRACLGIPLDIPSSTPLKQRLQSLKIDVNDIYTGQQWLSPLHQACTNGNYAIVELLVCLAGSRVNLRDKEGWTALHCACAEGHIEIVELLGRCQGYIDGEVDGEGWIYPPDGPIELSPKNSDGEIPQEVALEEQKAKIKAILEALKSKFPQPSFDESEDEVEVEEALYSDYDSEDIESQDEEVAKRSNLARLKITEAPAPKLPVQMVTSEIINITENVIPSLKVPAAEVVSSKIEVLSIPNERIKVVSTVSEFQLEVLPLKVETSLSPNTALLNPHQPKIAEEQQISDANSGATLPQHKSVANVPTQKVTLSAKPSNVEQDVPTAQTSLIILKQDAPPKAFEIPLPKKQPDVKVGKIGLFKQLFEKKAPEMKDSTAPKPGKLSTTFFEKAFQASVNPKTKEGPVQSHVKSEKVLKSNPELISINKLNDPLSIEITVTKRFPSSANTLQTTNVSSTASDPMSAIAESPTLDSTIDKQSLFDLESLGRYKMSEGKVGGLQHIPVPNSAPVCSQKVFFPNPLELEIIPSPLKKTMSTGGSSAQSGRKEHLRQISSEKLDIGRSVESLTDSATDSASLSKNSRKSASTESLGDKAKDKRIFTLRPLNCASRLVTDSDSHQSQPSSAIKRQESIRLKATFQKAESVAGDFSWMKGGSGVQSEGDPTGQRLARATSKKKSSITSNLSQENLMNTACPKSAKVADISNVDMATNGLVTIAQGSTDLTNTELGAGRALPAGGLKLVTLPETSKTSFGRRISLLPESVNNRVQRAEERSQQEIGK